MSFLCGIYGDDKFVMGTNRGSIVYSTDGINFTIKRIGKGNEYLFGITYSNQKFIIVGEKGLISKSTDGIIWTIPEQIKDESGKVVTANLNGVCAMP